MFTHSRLAGFRLPALSPSESTTWRSLTRSKRVLAGISCPRSGFADMRIASGLPVTRE